MRKIFALIVMGGLAYYALWVRVLPQSIPDWFPFFTIAIPIIFIAAITNLQKDDAFWLRVGLLSSVVIAWIVRDFRFEQILGAYFLVVTYLGFFLARKMESYKLPTPNALSGYQPTTGKIHSPSVPSKPLHRTKEMIIEDSFHRIRGIAVEKQAVDTLTLPLGWKKKASLYHWLVGGADLLITSPEEKTFIVEIKSWHGVVVHNNKLVRKRDKFKSVNSAASQLWRQVYAWKDKQFRQPVLWLPMDTENECFEYQRPGTKGKIIVVNGNQESLKRAIKAI